MVVVYVLIVLALVVLVALALSVRVLKQYERAVLFRLGRVNGGARGPGLIVFVPGVDATGVDIEARGPDLIITARKSHFVRVNWQSLHLETAQRDYLLRLRLGTHLDHGAMQAEIHEGVLTVTLPKRTAHAVGATARLRRVA